MIRRILLSVSVAFAIGLSAQGDSQKNKIPDSAREILERATQFELLSIGHYPSPEHRTGDFQG